jgi:hypothetical protein
LKALESPSQNGAKPRPMGRELGGVLRQKPSRFSNELRAELRKLVLLLRQFIPLLISFHFEEFKQVWGG